MTSAYNRILKVLSENDAFELVEISVDEAREIDWPDPIVDAIDNAQAPVFAGEQTEGLILIRITR